MISRFHHNEQFYDMIKSSCNIRIESKYRDARILRVLIEFRASIVVSRGNTKRRDRSVGRRTAERVGFSASSVTVESHDALSASGANSESTGTTTAMDVSTRATGADELKTLPLILFFRPISSFSAQPGVARTRWKNKKKQDKDLGISVY